MTEGEGPDILQQLEEILPSVEAHEQEARRDFQIRDYARKRQIPEEGMRTNETVQRYVTVLRDVDAAFERLRGSSTKSQRWARPN